MSMKMAVLVSGRGSNLEAILQAIKNGELDATVPVVISNNPEALALLVARRFGVHAVAIDHRGLSRKEHERLVLEELLRYDVEWLVLAGYMRILSPEFLAGFRDKRGFNRVINIHPSLLPAFPGARGYEEAYESGVRLSGITVHLVDEGVDTGPILAQQSFPRLEGDTLETFKQRGLALEHKLFPSVLQQIAREGVRLLTGGAAPAQAPRGSTTTTAGRSLLCMAVVPRHRQSGGKPVRFPLYWLLSSRPAETLLSDEPLLATLSSVLADPLLEELWVARPEERPSWCGNWAAGGFRWWVERQFLPGITDNLARTVEDALRLSGVSEEVQVASGDALLLPDATGSAWPSETEVEQYSRYRFYHPLTDRLLVHDLSLGADEQGFLGFPRVSLPSPGPVTFIDLELPDPDLEALSRERLLALNLAEMRAAGRYFRQENVRRQRQDVGLPDRPSDVELEIIAQTWSEHCKHKIFNARISHTDLTRPAAIQELEIESLYKTYIQGATKKLSAERDDLLSVFSDNAGVVRWNSDWGVCFKVETHNSPSALEPYGGALTGILGVNRDILGTGLGARPICNTDVFCFAYPAADLPDRPTMVPAAAIMEGVRKGVQDGGNKSGIPTVNGAIHFHPGYRAKPLVFCGTVGLLPLEVAGMCGFKKHTRAGDTIVMAGGRVGKDGIHGATFSSEALHEGSPASAVQIGDPFTQKRLLDFVLEARDAGLVSGITDNGAGGLSSSVGEMATITGGATLDLDDIPLKYPGLADYEIVISESQERMTISTRDFTALKALADKHRVEVTAVGTFHDRGYFEVRRKGKPVARLDLDFLHDGCPTLELNSRWERPPLSDTVGDQPEDLKRVLLQLLASPNICSREPVIRQYDHEVRGASVVKQLMGPLQQAPCDAAVIRPLLSEPAALAVSNGLCPQLSRYDTYLMAVCAVDEAVRNAVCVGADPSTLSLLDNFCWPDPVQSARNPDGPYKLAQLVRACAGLHDASLAYGAPLISGKDSMKNDFDDGVLRLSVPPTLLVSAIGRLSDADKAVTMQFKSPGDLIYLLSSGELGLAGSQYAELMGWSSSLLPYLHLSSAARLYSLVHEAMGKGLVESCHDLSEGGLAVALAESIIGSGFGADIRVHALSEGGAPAQTAVSQEVSLLLRRRLDIALFAEGPGRLLLTVSPVNQPQWESLLAGTAALNIGTVTRRSSLRFLDRQNNTVLDVETRDLASAWRTALPFAEELVPQ